MPRGTALTEAEKATILALQRHGLSERAIAADVGRSRPAVHAILVDPEGANIVKRPGRRPKLTPNAKRRLLREASKGDLSARALQEQLELPVGVRRVKQVLQESSQLMYEKRKASPVLTKRHKEDRLTWARTHVTWDDTKWANCVFSDEKKFNLDGPDGLQYYWHDLRREKKIFSKRQSGGGSVMVWGAFCAHGTSELVILEGTQDSERYVATLSEHLLPFIDRVYGRECIFQQDNASIHASRATKSFLQEENVELMSWPAKSPDLNPIEDMWGVLARAVYLSGRQFTTRADLISTIQDSWAKINLELIDKLVKSMPKRCVAVLELRGCKTKY
jgi:transposase